MREERYGGRWVSPWWGPEPPITPGEPDFITAGCGHEVYPGERMYYQSRERRARTLCPDCMEARFDALSPEEKAALLGCEAAPVWHEGHERNR